MSTTLKQADIEVYKGRDAIRKFTITVDGNVVDVSDGNINFIYVAEDGDPTEKTLAGVVGGVGSNEVTFTIPKADLGVIGLYEYKVVQSPIVGEDIPWFYGNMSVVDEEGITASLGIYIQDEKPVNLTLGQDKQNNRVRYWRNYLQILVDPKIEDADLDDESKWPFLVNVLIAKLVIYDCILLEYKNLAVTGAGASGDSDDPSTGAGPVKKIETGPTNAEWYDSSDVLSNMFKPNNQGETAFDGLKQDLCMLSRRVRIYLPICGQLEHSPIIPIKAEMDPNEGNSVTDILYKHNISNEPSQG